ncbi:hypothetical protein NFI96_026715 [Prochilodus magdalenae]|nr:hypothetical protein NFI96_026715 [Prochilodus magdalenae]
MRRMSEVAMEVAFKRTVRKEADAELELQQVVNSITQRKQGTCIVPKHYNLPEDSSEEEDFIPGHALQDGCGDCVCCVCGETFAFLNNLIEHFNVHKDEVRCHLCQVTFTRVISLALHLENAHPKYHLYCNSCKIRFRNTWHMNQHMEKHLEVFRNCKVEESDEAISPSCVVKEKPVDEDVEEVVIENEEVETKYLKEEEEEKEIVLGMMPETKEEDPEDNLWECAPIEEDIKEEDEGNVEIKEESDDSVYSPGNELNSDTDTGDCNNDASANGFPRLLRKSKGLRTRSFEQRDICTNSKEKPVRSVKDTASRKMQERNKSSVAGITEEDHVGYTVFRDHSYSRTQSLENPSDSDQAPAHNTRSSTRLSTDCVKYNNSASFHACNSKADTTDAKGDHQDKVEVVVLRTMPRRKNITHKGRVILQAAYEKVIKIPKLGNKPSRTEQEPTHMSSLSSSTSAGSEPAQLQVDIKVEDESEDNLWECAPIEEDMIKEEDDEENIEIKEESDSSLLDDSVYSPGKDVSSSLDTDGASSMFSDCNSHAPANSFPRLLRKPRGLRTRSIPQRRTCTNTIEKPASSGAGPQLRSSNEKPLSSRKCSTASEPNTSVQKPPGSFNIKASPEHSTSIEKALSLVKTNTCSKPNSVKDSQICSSCGLSKVAILEKPMERCKCMHLFACYMCGASFESNQLLLKHQVENHPLTKYICSTCLLVFPNQTSFTKHSCCTKAPSSQVVIPAKMANPAKSPSTMILKLVPSPAADVASKQPLNNGGSAAVSNLNAIYSNNLLNIVDTSHKLGTLSNSTIPVLPYNLSSNQTTQLQVSPSVTLNSDQKAKSLVLKKQDPVTSVSTATKAKTGQMQVLVPASSPASMKPAKVVLQGVVLPQQRPVQATNPVRVPLMAPASNQSRAALRIPTYPTASTKVTVSFSPTPVQFSKPTLVTANSMKTLPSTSRGLPGNFRSIPVPLPRVPVPVSSAASAPAHAGARVQSSVMLDGLSSPSSPVQVPLNSESSLKVVAMFVNQSQDLALQKRLRQRWRSKSIFPCRHCGVVARQPALGIRHRYRHRGPRLHRCQCGRTFQRLLYLLRHQVQHAEALRYVCAACGQTFQGTHHLACHKRKVVLKVRPSNTRKRIRRVCRNLFHCDCGQAFTRSSAFLWHKLKNPKSC